MSRLRMLLWLTLPLGALAVWRIGGADAQDTATAVGRRSTMVTADAVRPTEAKVLPGAPADAEVCRSEAELPRRREWADSDVPVPDPFAARVVSPSALRPVAVTAPPPVSAVLLPPPAQAVASPQLPFRFLGLLSQLDGADAKVFLLHGEHLLVARRGDVLEGGWLLQQIQPRHLSFERVSDRLSLNLAIDGH